MKLQFIPRSLPGAHWVGWMALITFLLAFTHVQAQPTIVSTVPAFEATGVSTTAAVVFTFSESMDTTSTAAMFFDESTFAVLTTTEVWSDNNTVLTCTPSPAFPVSTEILWEVNGQDPEGNALGGTPAGFFTTGTSGGGGGGGITGTNRYTEFGVGKAIYYSQTSTGTPTLSTEFGPYLFYADVTLSSNQSALSASLELPSAVVQGMNTTTEPGQFLLSGANTDQTTLDSTFGDGSYLFTVTAASSNEQVTIDLPASLPQPAAPLISNYTAAQSVNAAQAFTLNWESFVGGTATDSVYVTIGNAFSTPQPFDLNALGGTSTSVVIPANTLKPGTSYDSFISFYQFLLSSNLDAGYLGVAYRYSSTEFNLTTAAAVTTPLVLTNASWSGHAINFKVTSAIGQSLIIQYNTSPPPFTSAWQTLLTTTNTTGVVQVTDSVNTTNRFVFYRAQTGP
ncbi:MAG: Ig-like domain-containing protein [Verrucomicrobiota bacterium]